VLKDLRVFARKPHRKHVAKEASKEILRVNSLKAL